MIRSMTAFARKAYRGDEGELVWEIRSVNHRYLEVFVRLPEDLRALEPQVRERVGRRLARGKLDCQLRYRPGAGVAQRLTLNRPLVEALLTAVADLGRITGGVEIPPPMALLSWPGVLEEAPRDLSPVQAKAAELLEAAIDELVATREREGERLEGVIRDRGRALRERVAKVRERLPQVLAEVRARLEQRLGELSSALDPGRLEQEMVILAQRLDVDEEMERLAAHLDELERILDTGGAVGRRLDFLMQELNRETNTLTSKTSDVEVTRDAVEMKVLIEQIREQVQNLE